MAIRFVLLAGLFALACATPDLGAQILARCANELPNVSPSDLINGNIVWTPVLQIGASDDDDEDLASGSGRRLGAVVKDPSLLCSYREEAHYRMLSGAQCLPGAPCFRHQNCETIEPRPLMTHAVYCSQQEDLFKGDVEQAFVRVGDCLGLRAYRRQRVPVRRCRLIKKHFEPVLRG